MMNRMLPLCGFSLLLALWVSNSWGATPFALEVEPGWVWTGRADVRIPGDEGTRFSLTDDLDADAAPYVRGRLAWRPGPRHQWLLTVAPLEATARGTFQEETRFADTVFPGDSRVKATYRFNNYRLTYRYRWWEGANYYVDGGATLFVRDAKVTVASDTQRDSDDDLGFVPLVSFNLGWEAVPSLWLRLDGDALAAPQGRALDVLLAMEYAWRNGWCTGIGYRVLDGGADNDSVYTFATFHHAALLLRYAW